MRQISLKLKTYGIGGRELISHRVHAITLRFIFLSFGTLAFLYVLFLGNMILNIIERRSLEAEAQVLSSEVGNLELTYLSMSNNIDLGYSHSLGFKETSATFATRRAIGFKTENNVDAPQNDL